MVSSWDGGLLSGTYWVIVISPALHGPPKRCFGTSSCFTLPVLCGVWVAAALTSGWAWTTGSSTTGSASTSAASSDYSASSAAAAFFPFFLANSLYISIKKWSKCLIWTYILNLEQIISFSLLHHSGHSVWLWFFQKNLNWSFWNETQHFF